MSVELYCGDCLDVMRSMPDKSVDAIITDLPYGTTACSWDVVIPFDPMWKEVKRICKGVFVTTASQPFTSMLVMSNLEMFKYELIWDKGRGFEPQLSNIRPMKAHENVLIFCNGKTIFNPQKIKVKPHTVKRKSLNRKDGIGQNLFSSSAQSKTYDDSSPISVLESGFESDKLHPTQKPVALYEYLIRTYTNEGDTVLDFTMGSGTTGVACVQTGRNFIGVEIDPGYFKIAEKRIHDAQQQMRIEFPATIGQRME